MTKVLFLIEKPEGNLPCSVFAYFPEIKHNDDLMTCYANIGQHSACHPDYAAECKEAEYNQYHELLKELIGQGYKDLSILNAQTFECRRNPTISEISLGNGATHYRSFTASEIGIRKDGKFKAWFKADDGHRYYTS